MLSWVLELLGDPAAYGELTCLCLDKTYRMLTDFCGKPPRGNVAPWSDCLRLESGAKNGLTRAE